MDVLVGLVAIVVGLAALLAGYRLFRELLPIFGLAVGFVVGAGFIASLFGEGFLQGVLGIVIGLVVGLLFAAIAYTWWWFGVIIAIGGFGFALGYGVLPSIGIDGEVLSIIIGLAIGMVIVSAAIVLHLPRAIIIAETSLWGAAAATAGLLVIINVVDPNQLGTGAVEATIGASGIWVAAWIGLALVGMAAQSISTRDYELLLPDDGTFTAYRTAPPDSRASSGDH